MCKDRTCGCEEEKCVNKKLGCQALISSDCVNNVKSKFECLNIESGLTLTETLEEMDAAICEKFSTVTAEVTITNVGGGAGVYKDTSLTGHKRLRSIVGTGLAEVSQDENTITINVEPATPNLYSVENVGTNQEGLGIYKESETTGNTTIFKLKRIKSETLDITEDEQGDIISINTPDVSDVPRLIVNSSYTGDEELGTLAKPFKDIPQALAAFVGEQSNENPQLTGSEIIIQKGAGVYNYSGNLNYNNLVLIFEEGASVNSEPLVGDFLCDLDGMTSAVVRVKIILKEGSTLQLQKSGFKNRGSNVATSNFEFFKNVQITGTGNILQYSTDIATNQYTIFESNYTSTDTYKNDGASVFELQGVAINTFTQSLLKIGGNSGITFRNCDIALQGFTSLPTTNVFVSQIGGRLELDSSILSVAPFYNVTIDKVFSISKSPTLNPTLQIINLLLIGRMDTLIYNESNESATTTIIGTQTKRNLTQCQYVVRSPLTKHQQFFAFNNVFVSGGITNEVDLTANNTISNYNIFNGNVVENLRKFDNRVAAVSAGLKKGDKFINTSGVVTPTSGWVIDMIME